MAVERSGNNIQITNVKATVRALKEFTPDIHRRINRQIRKALETTKTGAFSRYPKGDWLIKVNTKNILGSVVARGGGTRGRSWADSSPGIKAAVFEFAGSLQPGKTPQAQGMIASLNARYGQPGRFLWDSWDASGKQALNDIEAAMREAERELQTRLDAMGEDF